MQLGESLELRDVIAPGRRCGSGREARVADGPHLAAPWRALGALPVDRDFRGIMGSTLMGRVAPSPSVAPAGTMY